MNGLLAALLGRRVGEIPVITVNRPSLLADDDGAFAIMSADELFAALGLRSQIDLLRELTGFPRAQFDRHCLSALHRFAEMAQLAPASQNHHHSEPGGLLRHTLEALAAALKLRRAKTLPLGCEPEDVRDRAPVWTMGVFALVLLHDLGKTFVDQRITLLWSERQDPRLWTPHDPPMRETGAARYRIEFARENRDYGLHQALGMSLFASVFVEARGWIASDGELLATISGILTAPAAHRNSPLANIIGHADRHSVSSDLLAQPPTGAATLPGATETRTIDHVTAGIRRLVNDRHVTRNRPGAPVFATAEHLFIVVPEMIDQLRHLLDADGIKLPKNNTRVFDIFADHGLALSREADGRSVHRIRVSVDEFSVELSALKLDAGRLFGNGDRPEPFKGEIEEVESGGARSEASKPAAVVVSAAVETPPPPPSPEAAIETISGAGVPPSPVAATHARAPAREPVLPRVTPNEGVKLRDVNLNPESEQFVRWLLLSLQHNSIDFNKPRAVAHFVGEGDLLLVSPAAFKLHLRQTGQSDEDPKWKALQNGLVRGGIFKKNAEKRHMHKFRVISGNGLADGKIISGMLVDKRHVARLISPIPPSNPHFEKVGRLLLNE